jgi:hypothetical protein
MLKTLTNHSVGFEICFWNCIFHSVKILQRIQNLLNIPLFHDSLNNRLKVLILVILLNAGLVIGLFLGQLQIL